jgi:UDPglucose 6-dehydrogenase
VLVRRRGVTQLVSLEDLYTRTQPGDDVEILTWRPDGDGTEFRPVALLTRREYSGDMVEVRTKMGRRVRCTPDHPFVTQSGRKLAEELGPRDWLPVAQGLDRGAMRIRPQRMNVMGAFVEAGLTPRDVLVRPSSDDLYSLDTSEIRGAVTEIGQPRGPKARTQDILRSGAMRLNEAVVLDIELEEAVFKTARNGTSVPATITADEEFWRIVGLYCAEGHVTVDGRHPRHRLQWSFHPTREEDLVREVVGFWESRGVKATVFRHLTTTCVTVSSRLLGAWWLSDLGLGRNCYEQRPPNLIWDQPVSHKRAFLAGLWFGDGSWSFVQGGPSVVLEYGTVSRELADSILRLLGELGIVARLKVGRTRKSTVDTYWLVVSGADQVEQLLDLVPERHRRPIAESIRRQAKRIAPTGFKRHDNAAWVRVVDVRREPFDGHVYSLEVPPTHTFVTTGGLVTSNCFPKDSLALKQLAANSGYHFQLLTAVIEVNELQKRRVIGKLEHHLGSVRGKTIALLGLAFKPHTDDMREAPSLVLGGRLTAEGAEVRAWDPVARVDGSLGIDQVPTVAEAVAGADAVVLVTEWPELAELDWEALADTMRTRVFVDGRNMLDPAKMRAAGFAYEGIGRAAG